jgi:O-antigen ligase
VAGANYFPSDRWIVPAVAGVACGLAFLPPTAAIALTLGAVSVPLLWHAFVTRWVLLFLGAVVLLPPLPIALGNSGPNAAVLVAGVGVLAGLARLREWRISFSPLHYALLAYIGALSVSIGFALVNSGPAIAAGSAARVVLFGIGAYVFLNSAQGPERLDVVEQRRATRMLFWTALAAALFGCVDFVLQLPAPAGFGPQYLWLDSGVYRRAQGLFYEASTLGNFCAFFVVMAGVMLTEPKQKRLIPAASLWLGILTFGVAMLLSFSRASVLSCGIALGTLMFLDGQRWRKYRALLALAVTILLAGAVFTLTLPEVAAGYWGRFSLIGSRALEAPDSVLSGRLESWRILGAFIADHPWQTLFGIGYKTLPYTEYLGHPVVADNAYLSMLIECGVLGMTALIALNFTVVKVGWQAMRRGSFYGKWIFCFWIGEMFQMLSGDILTYWRVLPVYFWVLAQAFRDRDESSTG